MPCRWDWGPPSVLTIQGVFCAPRCHQWCTTSVGKNHGIIFSPPICVLIDAVFPSSHSSCLARPCCYPQIDRTVRWLFLLVKHHGFWLMVLPLSPRFPPSLPLRCLLLHLGHCVRGTKSRILYRFSNPFILHNSFEVGALACKLPIGTSLLSPVAKI